MYIENGQISETNVMGFPLILQCIYIFTTYMNSDIDYDYTHHFFFLSKAAM